MRYIRKFGKFMEMVDAPARPKTARKTVTKTLKQEGAEATLQDVVSRMERLSDDSLKKLIEN